MEPWSAQRAPEKVQLESPSSDVSAPPSPPPVARDVAVPTEAKFEWFWCESCYIVTERSGDCPSCPRPLIAVTGDALPYGPYLPASTRSRRKRLRAGPVVAVSLIVVAAIVGGLLFRAGDPLGGAGAAGANAVHTNITIPVLGPMALPGQWTSDATTMVGFQQEYAGNSAVVKTALTDGYAKFAVITLPTAPPGGKSTSVGDACTFSDGTKCVVTDMEVLVIDGNTTLRMDKTGVQTSQVERLYFIVLPNQRIIVDIDTTGTPRPFAAIEAALLSYPKSTGTQQ